MRLKITEGDDLTLQTPLAHLMEMTKTTAKQISDYTGINVTLLSKFKNNQRRLNYHSQYPAMLSGYFLENETEQATQTVHRFLVSGNSELADAPHEKLVEALSLWLTGDSVGEEEPEYTPADVTGVFFDVNGLGESLKTFTDLVLAEEPGDVTVIHDFPDGGTFYTSLLDCSLPYLTKMRDHGCEIRILDTCTTPKTYMTIHNWMNFYFSEQVRIYADRNPAGLQRMLFILEDKLALLILGSACGEKAFLSTLFRKEDNVRFFQRSAKSGLINASKTIERIPVENVMEFLQILDSALMGHEITFLVNPIMMYKTMNREILNQVLEENDVPEELRPRAFETNRFTAYLRTKCPYRQIYNLDAMLEVAQQESYVDEELSELYGRPIRVSGKHLHDHIRFLTQLIGPDYQVLFVPFKNLYLLDRSVSYVVQDDGIFLAWAASRSRHRIYSRDHSVISASYNYMEEIWNSIPTEYTTPEWQNEQIQKLLELTSK